MKRIIVAVLLLFVVAGVLVLLFLPREAGHGMTPERVEVVTVEAGALRLSSAYLRATPPGAPVAGGFLTVTNTGAMDDALVAVSAAFSGRGEVHEMQVGNDGVMRMRPLPEGLALPAGEVVALQPGGFHLMFHDLTGPLEAGTTAAVTLTFREAGEVILDMPVKAANAAEGHGH